MKICHQKRNYKWTVNKWKINTINLVIFVSIAQYFAQSEQQWTYTSQRKYRWETDKVERVFVKLAMFETNFGETNYENISSKTQLQMNS
jgi:hypothetical protein